MIGEHRIITFCLTDEQNEFVRGNIPTKNYEVFDTDAPTDLIAISAEALIIQASELDEDSLGMIFDFYEQVGGCTDTSTIWLGEPLPPKKIQKLFLCYASFEEVADKLKYLLLTAHRKSKNAKEYSEKFYYGLRIVSMIRSRPGIRTKELAEELELSPRTVQRYITALQVAGEYIDYDPSSRGWKLLANKSIFFNDF